MNRRTEFYNNPHYEHVFNALKEVKADIEKYIDNQRVIFFDCEPMDYSEDDERVDKSSTSDHMIKWNKLYQLIFLKKGGI